MADITEHDSIPPSSSPSDDVKKLFKQESTVDPLLLMESAGKKSCCIFRIPNSFAQLNPKAYKLNVVSIGPYHYGEKDLQMIQQHKPRFLKLFLDKARKKGVQEDALFKAVMDLEEVIRKSYSVKLDQSSSELAYMMILDGCFILMSFLVVSRRVALTEDPVFTIPWILPSIRSDFLSLENQVPFIVLQTLLKESKIDPIADLNEIAFNFFDLSMKKPKTYWDRYKDVKAKHLLDLIRMIFSPMRKSEATSATDVLGKKSEYEATPSSDIQEKKPQPLRLISSAKRLRQEGIKFRARSDADSVLSIVLENNRLLIPVLRLDGFISRVLFNCVIYEQFYGSTTKDITSYVVFMGCLLKGEEDVSFFSNNKGIIENYYGSENEVSEFFKTICQDIAFEIETSYLQNVFEGVNSYTSKWYNGVWAGFKHTHFESPWTCLSSFAVIFVIILTMLSTTFAVLSYLNDKKGDGKAG